MIRNVTVLSTILFTVVGCRAGDNITATEAREALDESATSSEAAALTSNSIELSTNFTLAAGVERAAEELKGFIVSQLQCADVTVSGGTLTVVYGAKPGNCTYRGHTFSGSHSITLSREETGAVVVDHTWTELSNGLVEVSGSAHVTWAANAAERRVQHELSWKRLSDGRTGTGNGDRTQRPLPTGLETGISVEGTRSWTGQAGTWELGITAVEMRWQDPIPQAGTYALDTPNGKHVELDFERVDDDTIEVIVHGARRDFSFEVSKTGEVREK